MNLNKSHDILARDQPTQHWIYFYLPGSPVLFVKIKTIISLKDLKSETHTSRNNLEWQLIGQL